MVLNLIPKPKYEEEEAAAIRLPKPQAVNDFSDAALAQDLPLTLQEKVLGKAVAILTPPEGLPGPVKFLYRPLLLGAVGIHALLFFAPTGGGHKEEKPAEKEKPLTITQVATGKAQPKLTKVPLSKLPPAIVKPNLPKLDRPTSPNAPVIKTPDAPPPATTTTTAPPPAAQTQTNTPPANLPNVTPAPPGGGAAAGDPFENFDINYPGATNSGAYYQANGAGPAAVESFFKGQKGFETKEGASTAARKVLSISKGGKTLYIGLFPDGGNTVYIQAASESEIPDSLDKVKKVKALPVGYNEVIAAAQEGGAEPSDFANPTPYFDENNQYAIGVQTMNTFRQDPAGAYALLAPSLQSKFKSITPEPAYNGGLLYKMTSDAGEFYLNIVPATTGGSIVITFSDRPG